MKAVLLRTGSVPVLHSASPKVSVSTQDSVAVPSSPRRAMRVKVNDGKRNFGGGGIRRTISESEMMKAENEASRRFMALSGAGSLSFPARIPEEEFGTKLVLDDRENCGGMWPGSGKLVEESGISGGGGIGRGKVTGGRGDGSSGGYDEDRKSVGAYYEKLLKSNPGDSLLLRNYGKFLQEVEKDMPRAEEYYGRAILASQGTDGEVLSLYGKLIWETQRDKIRAKSYFDQALLVSPADSTVLGSYAQFLWEAEEDEEEMEINTREAEFAASVIANYV